MDEGRRTTFWGPREQPRDDQWQRDEDDASIGVLLGDALRVIRHRSLLALAVFCIVAIPAGLYIKHRPLEYRATARLMVVSSDEARAVGRQAESGDEASANFQTMMQVLRSRPLVAKAIVSRKLWEMPGFQPARAPKSSSEADVSASGLVDAFLAHLSISATPGTRILNISYQSTDPATAMVAVNALVETQIAESSKAESTASGEALEWLNARLAEARDNLHKSETALQNYVESKNAISLQDRQNIVTQKLEDLNAALTRAKTQRIAKETLYNQVQSMQQGTASLETLPLMLSNAALQQQRSQLAELRQKERLLAADLGDRHPDLVKLRSDIAATDARLKAEVGKIVESVKNDYLAAQAEEESLSRALDAQKRDVLDLNRKGVEFAALERQATSDKEIYQKLLGETQTRSIIAKAAQTRIEILESAEMPRGALGLPKVQLFALALAAAFMLGIVAPIVREVLDQRIKTSADLEKRLPTRCLAMIPKAATNGAERPPLVSSDATPFNEAFRRLRTSLLLHQSASGCTRILVTSASPREGKSLVASNLAASLAQLNQRVLLVEGDLRRPNVHKILGVRPSPGLADLLSGKSAVAEVIRPSGVLNLSVLPCGTKHTGTSELLSSPRLNLLLSHVDKAFDWVVFDSPPLGPVADACVLGQLAHHAVLVVSAGSTPIAGALLALKQLAIAKVALAGAVLNGVDLQRAAYYYAPYQTEAYGDYYVKPPTKADRAAALP